MYERFESGYQARLLTTLLRNASFAARNIKYLKPDLLFDDETDKKIVTGFLQYIEDFRETPVQQELLGVFVDEDEYEAIVVRLDEIYEAEFNSEGVDFLEEHLHEYITRQVLYSLIDIVRIDLENGVPAREVCEYVQAQLNEIHLVIEKVMMWSDMRDFDKWWRNRVRRLERKTPDPH